MWLQLSRWGKREQESLKLFVLNLEGPDCDPSMGITRHKAWCWAIPGDSIWKTAVDREQVVSGTGSCLVPARTVGAACGEKSVNQMRKGLLQLQVGPQPTKL